MRYDGSMKVDGMENEQASSSESGYDLAEMRKRHS